MEVENKKVTRRKFLEDSSRKALAGSAAAFLGLGMIKTKSVKAAGCWPFCIGGCDGFCTSCQGSCDAVCEDSCSYGCTLECSESCTGSCTGSCMGGCTGSCSGCTGSCSGTCEAGCDGSGRSVSAAEAECGTPVTEREASSRYVTV